MKNFIPLLFLLTTLPAIMQADTWTSTDGRTLEGEFVNYDDSRGVITIRRQDDDKSVDIPEELLIHADILKAIELENKRVQPYWYVEYSVAQTEKPSSRCLLLVPNGEATEAFELIML
ncbi:MAG: hypothetical protein Q7Q73_11135 [Verrucomicrobiota bacterium JB024]|nr:hypothetical protein [Verrucomicrobiota bacterium JB024]